MAANTFITAPHSTEMWQILHCMQSITLDKITLIAVATQKVFGHTKPYCFTSHSPYCVE